MLSDLPIDSIDKLGSFDTQPIDTSFFFLNDNSEEKFIAPEGDSLPLYHFVEAETDVSVEDCGSSSTNRNPGRNISPKFQKKVFRQFRNQRMDIFTKEMRKFPEWVMMKLLTVFGKIGL